MALGGGDRPRVPAPPRRPQLIAGTGPPRRRETGRSYCHSFFDPSWFNQAKLSRATSRFESGVAEANRPRLPLGRRRGAAGMFCGWLAPQRLGGPHRPRSASAARLWTGPGQEPRRAVRATRSAVSLPAGEARRSHRLCLGQPRWSRPNPNGCGCFRIARLARHDFAEAINRPGNVRP